MVIPENVTRIGTMLFFVQQSCIGRHPGQCYQHEDFAFMSSLSLNSVVIPTSVSFGTKVFYGQCHKDLYAPGVTMCNCDPTDSTCFAVECLGKVMTAATSAATARRTSAFPTEQLKLKLLRFTSAAALLLSSYRTVLPALGSAFYGCTSLASVVIPYSVTSIGSSAFGACSSLASVVIAEGVKTINNHAFRSCSSLESVVIPDSVGHWELCVSIVQQP